MLHQKNRAIIKMNRKRKRINKKSVIIIYCHKNRIKNPNKQITKICLFSGKNNIVIISNMKKLKSISQVLNINSKS